MSTIQQGVEDSDRVMLDEDKIHYASLASLIHQLKLNNISSELMPWHSLNILPEQSLSISKKSAELSKETYEKETDPTRVEKLCTVYEKYARILTTELKIKFCEAEIKLRQGNLGDREMEWEMACLKRGFVRLNDVALETFKKKCVVMYDSEPGPCTCSP